MASKTGSQGQAVLYWPNLVPPTLPASFSTYRALRKHPTVALARRLSIAPILRGSWGLEGPAASDETLALAQAIIARLRSLFVGFALRGLWDYGFVAFEQYLNMEDKALVLKPLLADNIKVRVDSNGDFAGLEVLTLGAMQPVVLQPDECVFLGLDSEAGNFYGEGMLEIARGSVNEWNVANAGADRYDAKVAGTHLVLYYPPGKSLDEAGVEQDNLVVAQQVLSMLESSGSAAIQDESPQFLDDLSKKLPPRWHVEYLSDSSPRQGSFIERMKYLDCLIVRAFGLPERAVLEGEFGTKAEAGIHQDLALTAMEAVHEFLTEEFERQVLQPYIRLMLGLPAAESVNLTAGPISREAMSWKRKLVEAIIPLQPQAVDLDALLDEVGVVKAETTVE